MKPNQLTNSPARLAAVALTISAVWPVAAQDEADEDLPDPIPVANIVRDEPVDFGREIQPLLRKNCTACHNQTKAKGKLNLETPETMRKGGNEGPAIVPGKADESLMLVLASHQDDPVMPPEGNKAKAKPFTPEELGLLKLWINQGAKGKAVFIHPAPEKWLPQKKQDLPIYSAAMSADGNSAVAARGNRLFVYDLTSGRLARELTDPALDNDTPQAHLDYVQSLAFHGNTRIASGGFRTVKIWDYSPPKATVQGEAMPETVTALAVDANSSRFAATDSAGHLRVWNPDKPHEKRQIKAHESPVAGVALMENESLILTIGRDGHARAWKTGTLEKAAEWPLPGPAVAMTIAGPRQFVIAVEGRNEPGLFQIEKNESDDALTFVETRKFSGHEKPVTCLTAVAGHMFSGSEDGTVRQWKLSDGNSVRFFSTEAPVRSVAASEDGEQVAAVDANDRVRLWNGANAVPVAEWTGRAALRQRDRELKRRTEILTLAQSERKKQLDAMVAAEKKERENVGAAAVARAKAEADLKRKELALADTPDDPKEQEKRKRERDAARLHLDKARQNAELSLRLANRASEAATRARLEFAAVEAALKELSADRETHSKTLGQDKIHATSVAFLPNNRLLVTGGSRASEMYNAGNGRFVDIRDGDASNAGLVSMHASGAVLSAHSKEIRLWNSPGEWTLTRTLGDGKDAEVFVDRVTALAFSPDGRRLATGGGVPSRSGMLRVWDLEAGKEIARNEKIHSDTIAGLAFSPDGRHLATASTDRFMRVFTPKDCKLMKAFEGHTSHVLDVSWRADGLQLATAGADKVVKVWDFEQGTQIKTIQGYNKEVTGVRYVGTSGALLTSAGDNCVRLGEERLGGVESFVYRTDVNASGELFLAAGQDSALRVWRAKDKNPILTLKP